MIFEPAAAMTVTAVILEIWLVWRFRFLLELWGWGCPVLVDTSGSNESSLIRRPARRHLPGNRG